MHKVVVIDNGGGTCKVGFGGEDEPRKVFPNCTAKPKGDRQTLVGDQLLEARDISCLNIRRPFDRGYLVNWDLEREIWARAFRQVLRVDPSEAGLLMTEPLFNFPQIQQTTEEVVFEEFGFTSYWSGPAPLFSLHHHASVHPEAVPANQVLTGVVVDAGFSFTHVVPIFNGSVLLSGVRRLNLGGKVISNYLKEVVSYRSFNMMEESVLLEIIKEQACFVSEDLEADLKKSRLGSKSPLRCEYVLPDGVHNLRGYMRDPSLSRDGRGPGGGVDQVLVLNNERFLVPEVIFSPSDIGLEQCGVAEAVVEAVRGTPAALHPLLYTNVLLTGGTVKCPGFAGRFMKELRPLVMDECQLNVYEASDPMICAWQGASQFVKSGRYKEVAITRQQYEEEGPGRGTHGGRVVRGKSGFAG